MQRKLYPEKAEHSSGGHADLFWSVWISCGMGGSALWPKDCPKTNTCTVKPEHTITRVKWSGYNDANWWTNVAPTDQARIRTMPCGRRFEINFETCEVFELIDPDFTEVTTKELVDELCKREGVRKFTTQPNAKYCIEDETGIYENGDGPVTIMTVIEDEQISRTSSG